MNGYVALVMAGGPGTRFWPLSRFDKPKQLLKLIEGESILLQTLRRLEGLFTPENIFIITNVIQVRKMLEELPTLLTSNIIEEPFSRDTAACIGLAAIILQKRFQDPIFCALPADHYIKPTDRFQRVLLAGRKLAMDGMIVTIGIKPSYPSTHMGYLQKGESLENIEGLHIHRLKKFCEKPTEKSATRFIATREYFWNSGIFIWKSSVILEAIKSFMPDIYGGLMHIKDHLDAPSFNEVLRQEYQKFRRISIDFGVMEKITNGVIIEADFEWDDLGSFLAITKYKRKDEDGNIVEGSFCGLDTSDSLILSKEDHLIATIGVKDLIIVHTDDATFISSKKDLDTIKNLIEKIKSKGFEKFL
jgi:mannose-1-phosphate guanylyltransferase